MEIIEELPQSARGLWNILKQTRQWLPKNTGEQYWKSGDVVVARFGDEVTLKRFVRVNKRHVELRPESHNPVHEPIEIDLAKHILHIDGVAVGALIGKLRTPEAA